MSNIRATMDTQPKKILVEIFSLPENEQLFRYCRLVEENAEAWGVFVSNLRYGKFCFEGRFVAQTNAQKFVSAALGHNPNFAKNVYNRRIGCRKYQSIL